MKTIHATSQVVFYTGNAGAVEVSFNGKNVPLTGGPNAEQVLVFDSRGVVPDSAIEDGCAMRILAAMQPRKHNEKRRRECSSH